MQEEIKEIIGLNCEEEIEVKYFAKDNSLAYKTMDYSELLDYITNLQEENELLNNIIDELEKYIEEEKTRLASECSNIYEDSLGKTKKVNEDIFNELNVVLDKLKNLKEESK